MPTLAKATPKSSSGVCSLFVRIVLTWHVNLLRCNRLIIVGMFFKCNHNVTTDLMAYTEPNLLWIIKCLKFNYVESCNAHASTHVEACNNLASLVEC